MRCVRCGRRLSLAKVTVTTRAGQSSWGPVCARKAGLLPVDRRTKAARPIRMAKAKPEIDKSQMALEFA